MTRADLQKLALEKLRDAELLLRERRYASAYYTAGCVVECALKACVARRTRRYEFADKNRTNNAHTHDLKTKLMEAANIEASLVSALRNPAFKLNWEIVGKWRVDSRYDRVSKQRASELLAAISDPHSGILQWLKQHW